MSPIDTLNQLLGQRRAAIKDLISGLQSKIGKKIPDDAMIAILILIANELGNFYRVLELQSNLMIAIQRNMDAVALEAFDANDDGAKELLAGLHKELSDVIQSTIRKWNTENNTT